MLLTVDMGNSRIKWAVFSGEDALKHGAADKLDAFAESLPDIRVEEAAVASVVPGQLDALCGAIARRTGRRPRVAGADLTIPIENLCRPPQQVGVDRLLNALAAFARYGRDCVVVDAGSAVTADAVDRQGRFLGGAIAPGPGLLAKALEEHTAQLPRVPVGRPDHPVGRNTQAAIRAGVYWGAVGMISELVRRAGAELRTDAPVIATGGWADLLRDVRPVDDYDPHLTLRGLRLACEASRGRQGPGRP